MYKVENFQNDCGVTLQEEIKKWIEERKHISISFVNIWTLDFSSFATIVYVEKKYIL